MSEGMEKWCAEHRTTLTVTEMVVKALGARYPTLVAQRIEPGCRDIPAAVAALRARAPHWFEPAPMPAS